MPRGAKPGERRGGRARGTRNKRSEGVEQWAREAVERPEYRDKLMARLEEGVLAPAVETMLFHYAYGKPTEHVEHTGANNGPLVILYGSRNKKSLI
jgi:hypothetical protein